MVSQNREAADRRNFFVKRVEKPTDKKTSQVLCQQH
jgi:hypothetical protein